MRIETTGRIVAAIAARADKIDTRRRLLEAGIRLFLENGYHGTGLKAVLDDVGIPKGSFYNYFDSKDAFGVATISFYADGMGAKLADALAAAADPVAGLRAFFEGEMAQFERSGFVGGCLVANLGGELEASPRLREALAEAFGRYLGGICEAVAAAQGQGLVRGDVAAVELARVLVDAWEGAVIRMKIERSLEPLAACLRHVLGGYLAAGA